MGGFAASSLPSALLLLNSPSILTAPPSPPQASYSELALLFLLLGAVYLHDLPQLVVQVGEGG